MNILEIIKKILRAATAALNLLKDILKSLDPQRLHEPDEPKEPEELQEDPRLQLLSEAIFWLGKDASPKDEVSDEFACVESMGNIISEADLPFPKVYHTAIAVEFFKKSPNWKGTLDLLPGNVIINATGSGNGSMRGHCGILLENGRIASNDSKTGLWDDNYSIVAWRDYFRYKGGMPTLVFQPI